MNRLKYLFLLFFIFSIFGCVSMPISKDQDITEHDLWYQEHEWLMLKQEKSSWKGLKTSEAKEKFIEEFYEARDPDTFTFKNEFKTSYQKNLEKVHKDYSDFKDPRRYIYLLFGEPKSKRSFTDQAIFTNTTPSIRIHVNHAEIWQYKFGNQRFQVIFAKISPFQLQQIKDRMERGEESSFSHSFYSLNYELLYIGPERYADITRFFENFFQENFQLRATSDILNDLKQQIIDRAENFYKKPQPKAKKGRYLSAWDKETQVYIQPFEIKSPEEVGVAIWIWFDKDSLNYNSKKKRYESDMSLYAEMRDASGRQMIYYCDDSVQYSFEDKKIYCYHFWGSLPIGDYKFILELGENISKKYTKVEKDINIFDYSIEGLEAGFMIGKISNNKDGILLGKPSYFSLEEGMFYPAAKNEQFKEDDEIVAVLDILGFQKNLYGNPYLELFLIFINGDIKDGEFIPTGETYTYRFLPIEKDGDRIQGAVKIKIKDLVAKLKISAGLYKVGLLVQDGVAGSESFIEYLFPILISHSLNNSLNNFIRRMD